MKNYGEKMAVADEVKEKQKEEEKWNF